jgi:hypothetical protein
MNPLRKTGNPWLSHDWKVKTLISVTRGGSRLGFTCRSCERTFTHVTGENQTWATNGHDVALTEEVSRKWLTERCPVRPEQNDVVDRTRLKNAPSPAA